MVAVKLSLPALTKAKLHYPYDKFTYEVNFTCPLGQTQCFKDWAMHHQNKKDTHEECRWNY